MVRVVPRLSLVFTALCLAGAAHAQATSCPATLPAQGAPIAAPLPVFPADNWWNTDISTAPVDPYSPTYIAWIDPARQVRKRRRQHHGQRGQRHRKARYLGIDQAKRRRHPDAYESELAAGAEQQPDLDRSGP